MKILNRTSEIALQHFTQVSFQRRPPLPILPPNVIYATFLSPRFCINNCRYRFTMNALACTVPLDTVTAPAIAHIHSPATLRIPDRSKLSFYISPLRRILQKPVSNASPPLLHNVYPYRQ